MGCVPKFVVVVVFKIWNYILVGQCFKILKTTTTTNSWVVSSLPRAGGCPHWKAGDLTLRLIHYEAKSIGHRILHCIDYRTLSAHCVVVRSDHHGRNERGSMVIMPRPCLAGLLRRPTRLIQPQQNKELWILMLHSCRSGCTRREQFDGALQEKSDVEVYLPQAWFIVSVTRVKLHKITLHLFFFV